MATQDVNKNISIVFVKFITGTYLDTNKYAAAKDHYYNGEEYDPGMFRGIIQGFIANELRADMEYEGKNMVQIVVDSLIEGSRYALDDDGAEIEWLFKSLKSTVSKEIWETLTDSVLQTLVVPLKLTGDEEVDCLEDYIYDEINLNLRACIFYHLYGHLRKMNTLEEWKHVDWKNIKSKGFEEYEENDEPVLSEEFLLSCFKSLFEYQIIRKSEIDGTKYEHSEEEEEEEEKENEEDEATNISKEIVGIIRETIKENQADWGPDADHWNEEEGGAGWLDNEVGMALEILGKLNKKSYQTSFEGFDTVEDFQERLSSFSLDELKFIKYFVEQGGSDQDEIFDVRDKKPEKEAREWFIQNINETVDDEDLKKTLFRVMEPSFDIVNAFEKVNAWE